jgi:hypothetical protein
MGERAYIVIPALNEASRIAPVLEAALQADPTLVDTAHIIVVDNGSTDETAKTALQFTDHVISCSERGKGHAMHAGVAYAKQYGAKIITFLDADQTNLRGDHVDVLSQPVTSGEMSMTIGIMGARSWLGQTSLIGAFSGQRCVTIAVWDLLVPEDLLGWRTEGALNALFRNSQREHKMTFVYLDGVGQVNKFAKGRPSLQSSAEYLRMSGSALRGLWGRTNL